MKNDPAVSIVVPAYNHEAFVEAALRSALSQTMSDLELIVIDDASADRTRAVIDGVDDPRIRRYYHEKNLGSAATLNEGIGLCRGQYVAVLNSDDVFSPSRLERLSAAAEETGASFLASDVALIDAGGTVIRDKSHWWISWYEELKRIYRESGDIIRTILTGNVLLTTSNFFIRRDVFDVIGRFNDYRYVLDYEFIFRFLAERPGGLLFLPDEMLLSYRLHGGNTIREDRVGPNRETFDILLSWYPHLVPTAEGPRFRAFEGQLRKVEGYTAIESARLGQKEAEELHRLRNTVWEKDQAKSDLYSELRVRDERIACMHEERDRLAGERDRLLALVKEREEEVRKFHNWNLEKDSEMARLRTELDAVRTTLADKEAELLAAFRTRSYRLGYALLQPARILRRLLRPQ